MHAHKAQGSEVVVTVAIVAGAHKTSPLCSEARARCWVFLQLCRHFLKIAAYLASRALKGAAFGSYYPKFGIELLMVLGPAS